MNNMAQTYRNAMNTALKALVWALECMDNNQRSKFYANPIWVDVLTTSAQALAADYERMTDNDR